MFLMSSLRSDPREGGFNCLFRRKCWSKVVQIFKKKEKKTKNRAKKINKTENDWSGFVMTHRRRARSNSTKPRKISQGKTFPSFNLNHTCVALPRKKKTKSTKLRRNSHLDAPLPRVFCVRYLVIRNSAITPASPLILKCTTLRWTLWCSHYSVAKRQQFSCPLVRTATLSLKFENVVPGRWIFSFSYCGQLFFYCRTWYER